jgi:hypothetical protein
MIKIFNSAYRNSEERLIPLDEVNIVSQKICQWTSAPYILFEHKDFPLGALRAEFDGTYWVADLN